MVSSSGKDEEESHQAVVASPPDRALLFPIFLSVEPWACRVSVVRRISLFVGSPSSSLTNLSPTFSSLYLALSLLSLAHYYYYHHPPRPHSHPRARCPVACCVDTLISLLQLHGHASHRLPQCSHNLIYLHKSRSLALCQPSLPLSKSPRRQLSTVAPSSNGLPPLTLDFSTCPTRSVCALTLAP